MAATGPGGTRLPPAQRAQRPLAGHAQRHSQPAAQRHRRRPCAVRPAGLLGTPQTFLPDIAPCVVGAIHSPGTETSGAYRVATYYAAECLESVASAAWSRGRVSGE